MGTPDEISPDFDAQCGLVSELGLKYPEFRSALGGFSGPELFTDAWRAFTDISEHRAVPLRLSRGKS